LLIIYGSTLGFEWSNWVKTYPWELPLFGLFGNGQIVVLVMNMEKVC